MWIDDWSNITFRKWYAFVYVCVWGCCYSCFRFMLVIGVGIGIRGRRFSDFSFNHCVEWSTSFEIQFLYKFKTMLTTMMGKSYDKFFEKFYGLINLKIYFVIWVLKHISDIGHNENELRKKLKIPIVLIHFTDFHKSINFSLIYQWFVFCLVCGIFFLYLCTITNSATWCDFRKSKSIYTMIIIHLFLFEIGNVLELVLHLIQAHIYVVVYIYILQVIFF